MTYNFDNPPRRQGTASLKWEKYRKQDVIPLWVADMDFVSAPEIVEALQGRATHGVFGYTVPGEEVRRSVVNYLERQHGYAVDPRWIIWTPSVVPALNLFCRAFGQPGDSVMTATPVYAPFLTAPVFSRKKLIAVDLIWDGSRWTFDFEAMEKAIRPHTKSFILCNPHNPVGRVFSKSELRALGEFCIRHDLILCSDEIHSDLILENHLTHLPTNLLGPEVSRRTVMLMSPSKTYNLPGLCCAYAVIENPDLRATFKRAARGIITEINAFGYVGCQTAYDRGEPWRQALLQYLRLNRDFLYTFAAEKLPGIEMRPMEATYLAWMDVRPLRLSNPAAFFEEHGVGLSDGAAFGSPGRLRLNFGCPRRRLQKALERMAAALASR